MGLLLVMMLVLTLISLRKEARRDDPVGGLFSLTLIIISLRAFIALCSAYQAATSLQKLAPRIQTETVKSDALPQ